MDLDEIVIADQVMATHDPNGGNDLNANFVIEFVENILKFNTVFGEVKKDVLLSQEPIQDSTEVKKDMLLSLEPIIQNEILYHIIQVSFEDLEDIIKGVGTSEMFIQDSREFKQDVYQIIQLSFEVAFKSLNNSDCHSATIYLLSVLSTYPWEAKVIMILAAFSLIYGDFITVSRYYHRKRLANKLALFKQNLIIAPSYHIKKSDDDFTIKFIVDLVKCVIKLNQPSSFSPPQSTILATYWIARSVLTYTQRIFCVESKNEIMEESTLISKSKSILSACYPLREAKITESSYEALLHAFSHSLNNSEVLKLIFNVNDDKEEIFSMKVGSVNNQYGVDALKNRRLLLIIVSDTNVSEAAFICRQLNYIGVYYTTIIWIPITDNPELCLTELAYFGSVVLDPRKRVTLQFIRFVKERCFPAFQDNGEPIVISLDNRGRLVHSNALHMILTWRDDLEYDIVKVHSGNNIISLFKKELMEMTSGVSSVIDDIEERISELVGGIDKTINDWRDAINQRIYHSDSSYNYTSKMERELWDKEIWNLKLLVHKVKYLVSNFYIDGTISDWIEQKDDIFLCGGNDVRCVQEFATKVKEVNSKTQLNIKFAYIGKDKKVKSAVENISDYAFSYEEYRWFWTRLQSMFLSRINYLNKVGRDEARDKIVLGLQKLLAYETKGTTVGGWVLLSKGEELVTCDLGDKMLKVMNGYNKWKDNVRSNGFAKAFKDCYQMLASSSNDCHSCCTLEYPSTLDKIPKDVECPQCLHTMHKFETFTCYHDHDIWS